MPTTGRHAASRPKGLVSRLFEPVDVASLAVWRIGFGTILAYEMWAMCHKYKTDDLARDWAGLPFHFTYYGFDWVTPWPGDGMFFQFVALGVLAVFIMVGLYYRLSIALFFLGWTHAFLVDQTYYQNHIYLICLLTFLMIFMPAAGDWSLDAWRRPKQRSSTVPAWCVYLLRAQIGIVYFYAGVAKLGPDWLRGEPVRTWLPLHANVPVLGAFTDQEWLVWFFAYGGLVFDLSITFFLLWRRTRPAAFAAALGFHTINSQFFDIGIFPWMMIIATTLFFEPAWPRRLLRLRVVKPNAGWAVAGNRWSGFGPSAHRLVVALLTVYLLAQILLPLRHFLYPGNTSWTDEGNNFAWRMKLHAKEGLARFYVTAPATGKTWTIDPDDLLTGWQASRMAARPQLIHQFSHYLAELYREKGVEVEVRVGAMVSLNNREPQLIIDPNVDLAATPRTLRHQSWLLPLTEPLHPPHP